MNFKMLEYEKISTSEGTDTNKTSPSKECMLYHYWYFKDVGFKFELHVCNKCHDVLMIVYELKNIAILNVKGADFRCILWGISRDEVVSRLNNSDKQIMVQIKRQVHLKNRQFRSKLVKMIVNLMISRIEVMNKLKKIFFIDLTN